MKCFFTAIGSNEFKAFLCRVFILYGIVIVSSIKTGLSQTAMSTNSIFISIEEISELSLSNYSDICCAEISDDNLFPLKPEIIF